MKIFLRIILTQFFIASAIVAANANANDSFNLACTNHKNNTPETYTLEFMKNRQVAMISNRKSLYLFEYLHTNQPYRYHKFINMAENNETELFLDFEPKSSGKILTFWGADGYMRSCKTL